MYLVEKKMAWTRRTEGTPDYIVNGQHDVPGGLLVRAKTTILHNCKPPRPPGIIFGRWRHKLFDGDTFICASCEAHWDWHWDWADCD